MKQLLTALLLSAAIIAAPNLWAAQSFTLSFNGDNQWVTTKNDESLANLIKAAKKVENPTFSFSFPPQNRELSTKRLTIVRDILMRSLGHNIILQEKAATNAAANKIIITID